MSYSYSVQDYAMLSGSCIGAGNDDSSNSYHSFIDRTQAWKKTCFEQESIYCNANNYAMM